MLKSQFRKQTGFTIMELVVALGVMGILMAIASKAFNDTSMAESHRLQTDIDKIAAQTVKFAAGGVFTGVTMGQLCSQQYLNADVCGSGDGAGANPWAGNYTVAASGTNRFQVTVTAVPTNVGPQIAKYYSKTARSVNYASGSTTLTLIFGT
ncbi:prepilin-type N-terminal cleavage/methylation domain-containing protein [Shewanella aestuarii]|uniref:Prepilin-type N-terminal cleavage/methylation domain-containing protein n=1 Tax=Shewanella aestuarii TaxID=1028752 RepID=A0A6G9QQ14_9GAMM|nr:prepilin-type N-terminal cleavage/methylation domain-containing protein [Shewanella aestuarii]QIR16684.1 prepilin-type N-terminal cleavage/methylation domain-containing protein [Shewanella aestuarii]